MQGVNREAELTALHKIATTIQSADTVEAAAEQTVAAAADILDFHICSLMIWEDGWLVPYAVSEDSPENGARRMYDDEGFAGKTFQTGESHTVSQVTPDDETDPAKDSYQSGVSVPIGEYGVFQAVSTETEAFDEQDVELAELLVSHTASALNRIEREADLEEKNDRLEAFASIVSHDLRSPLSVATARIELAAAEHESPHLDQAQDALDRMETLIDDLLTLSRQGAVIDQRMAVSLDHIAEECWAMTDTRRASLEISTDGTVQADRDRLKQLFTNLMRNSIQHGGDGVTVTIGSLPEQEGFYIADDGTGITADDRDCLFEYGYSTAQEGTGLGLRIVKQIADAHGWTIDVSESDAGGARFAFISGDEAGQQTG